MVQKNTPLMFATSFSGLISIIFISAALTQKSLAFCITGLVFFVLCSMGMLALAVKMATTQEGEILV